MQIQSFKICKWCYVNTEQTEWNIADSKLIPKRGRKAG